MANEAKREHSDASLRKKSLVMICSPMSLQELSPRRLPRPFRRWLDAASFQNVPDRVVCQIVAEVGQGSLYRPIAPRAILFSHAASQSRNFRPRWGPAPRLAPHASVFSANDAIRSHRPWLFQLTGP